MINKIQKILCPLDFSAVSENALKYAYRLADVYDAELHLLHVIEPATEVIMEVPHAMPIINNDNLKEVREQLKIFSERVLTDVAEQLKNTPNLFTDIVIGSRGLMINHEANHRSIDLVIMGTHDKEQKSWWQGSVASEVLESPAIPILIVPEGANYVKIDRVSFATDLRRGNLLHFLKIVDLLKPIKPEFRCIHVVETDNEETEIKLDELVQAFSHQVEDINITFHQLEEDEITEALEAFNLIYHIDLQVMVKTKLNFFQALFHRSQSKKTASYTHIPLLVLPE